MKKIYFDELPNNLSKNDIVGKFHNVAILDLVNCHLGPDPLYDIYFRKNIDVPLIEGKICKDFNIPADLDGFERDIRISETNQRTARIINELCKNGAEYFIVFNSW